MHFVLHYFDNPILDKIKHNNSEMSEESVMRYKVNIKKTEEGYAVWCPGLPGCWSQGQTEEEALEKHKGCD